MGPGENGQNKEEPRAAYRSRDQHLRGNGTEVFRLITLLVISTHAVCLCRLSRVVLKSFASTSFNDICNGGMFLNPPMSANHPLAPREFFNRRS